MNGVFGDGFFREIAELMITGFLGWRSLQPEAEKMLEIYGYMTNALGQRQSLSLSREAFQEAYDATCWLCAIACENGFEDMGGVFDEVARLFSHTVSLLYECA